MLPLPLRRLGYERVPLRSGSRHGLLPPSDFQRLPPWWRSGLLIGVLYFFLFVAIAGGVGIGYLVVNPPSDLIRQKITKQVKVRTGRNLVIAGPVSFDFFPFVGISFHDVSLSAPPSMDGDLFHAEALQVSIEATSLFERCPKINSMTLRRPVFDFRVDKGGRSNWEFTAYRAPTQVAKLQRLDTLQDVDSFDVATAEPGLDFAQIRAIANVRLNDIAMRDGTIRITDERTGQKSEVSGVNVKFWLLSLQSPLVANGNLIWHDQRLDFDGKIENVSSLLMNASAHLSFFTKNAMIEASYDGDMTVHDGAVYLEGQMSAKADSARQLAKWFRTRLPPVSGFGPLSIEGKLQTANNVTEFSNATFALDGETAKGVIKVTTGGARPFVKANLAISELDLNKYLTSAVPGTPADEGVSAPDAQPPAVAAAAGPDEIHKLLQKQGMKVYDPKQRAGWSSEALNLTLLGVADGNARVHVGKLHFRNISIGQSSIDIAVKNLSMQATFNDVAIYQGRGRGVLTIDGSAGMTNISVNFNLDSISALPFFEDSANFGWFSGKINVKLQLAANGASQLQLIESLNGSAGFQFSDGAIIGFNLPDALRRLSQGNFAALRASPFEKTDFSTLTATFTITNGDAQNQDLQFVSSLLRVAGGGIIHMPERTVDYTVEPKLITSLDGQSGNTQALGIEVPVRITGSWGYPSYHANLKGVLSNPNKTMDAIKKIGKKLKNKNADEIFDQLLGKRSSHDSSTERSKKNAKNLLNKLFSKQAD